MAFPRFSSTTTTDLQKIHPLFAIGAVVRDRLSGTLRLKIEKTVRIFRFEGGFCVNALSNMKSELPGAFLLAEGKFTPAQFEAYFAETRQPKSDAWEIAKRMAGLKETDLASLRSRLALQLVSLSAPVSDAEASFQPAPAAPPSPDAPHGLRLLMAGALALNPSRLSSLFPELQNDSVVRGDEKLEKTLEPLPLDPEERGLLTVVKNSRTVAEVFESSFLKRERIQALLFAFWLCGLVTLETVEVARRKTYEASLTPQDRATREEVRQFVLRLPQTNYYQWLGIHPNASGADILKQAKGLLEKHSAPSLEKAFQDERKSDLSRLLSAVDEALNVLLHGEKRAEYDRYLAGGKTGSFLAESAAVRTEAVFQEARAKIAAGKIHEALALFENALRVPAPSPRVAAAYARLLLTSGDTGDVRNREKAVDQIKRALQGAPEDPDLYLAFAEWCVALRQTDKAFEAYQRALDLDPTLLPAREALKRLNPDRAAKGILQAIHRNLQKLNHYQLLGIDPQASPSRIHAAYRDLSKQFHPDRFFQEKDAILQDLAKETFKRVVEAFMVLKASARRKEYDETLLAPAKAGVSEGPPSAPRLTGPTTRQGKKFFDLAMAALRDRKLDTAKLNLKLALQAEPDNPVLRKKLDEISRQAG